ncbi:MAG: hypothetical protein RBS07_13530 [Lentimicrobium sp.]|nr:hypothetical protein [Lentimicrobium sp.]
MSLLGLMGMFDTLFRHHPCQGFAAFWPGAYVNPFLRTWTECATLTGVSSDGCGKLSKLCQGFVAFGTDGDV